VSPSLGRFRAPQTLIERYHRATLWRDTGPIGDLCRFRREQPDHPAIIEYRGGVESGRLSYFEYAARVERFAGALHELGVRPGDVVAVQLPNVWQFSALLLAAARLGAVTVPVLLTAGSRELERILDRVRAAVCVTVRGDPAVALAESAPRLPALRHRVVLGASAAGEIDLGEFFERTPWERSHPVRLDGAAEDPDRLGLVFFTSGTAGEPKGVLHSFNTVYAGIAAMAAAEGIGPDDVLFIPHTLAFIGGTLYGIAMPLLTGAASILLDEWDGDAALRLLAAAGTTVLFGGPRYFHDLVDAARRNPARLPRLRLAISGATTVPQGLVRDVPAHLGVGLRTLWGMTEVVAHTWTRAGQPADWGTHSDGTPGAGLEIQLRAGHEISPERPARLYVRGAGVCLATFADKPGDLTVLADRDDGWLDTGDLAVPDGGDGIRIVSRVADRIGAEHMIPTGDVEDLLREHPRIEDVAIVGHVDGTGYESSCAVVVARGPAAPALAEIRDYLTRAGVTGWHQPTRVEVVAALPRNAAGKVRKDQLRRMLR
jgi:cyclohexanecarboxylate-CoA ligase